MRWTNEDARRCHEMLGRDADEALRTFNGTQLEALGRELAEVNRRMQAKLRSRFFVEEPGAQGTLQ